jgi:hypothetical protein
VPDEPIYRGPLIVPTRSERRSFSLKSPRRVRVLQVCGVIDLVCAIPITVSAVGLWIAVVVAAAGRGGLFQLVKFALICTIFGPLILWAGLVMVLTGVVITPERLRSGDSLWIVRSCPLHAVVAIDIRQDNFGRAARSVPFAVLRDADAVPLMPLSTVITRAGRQLETQRQVVSDLRQALGVEGADLDEADVHWPR